MASSSPSPHSQFLAAGIATSCATIFSNPLEVCKTRLQLQRELARGNSVYRGFFHTLHSIFRHEGIRGLQKGLTPGICYQMTMNGTRLGSYDYIKTAFGVEEGASFLFIKSLSAGAFSGAVAAVIGSPFSLVKTQLQASAHSSLAVGHQHRVTGMGDAFRQIVAREGAAGLFRGVQGQVMRVAVGSATQLSIYDSCKRFILRQTGGTDGVATHVAASLLSSVGVTTAMNPFDVAATRLYNQRVLPSGRGELYAGLADCFAKTFRAEGYRGLYKGWVAHYCRLGPHTVLTFVFWEQAKLITGRLLD